MVDYQVRPIGWFLMEFALDLCWDVALDDYVDRLCMQQSERRPNYKAFMSGSQVVYQPATFAYFDRKPRCRLKRFCFMDGEESFIPYLTYLKTY